MMLPSSLDWLRERGFSTSAVAWRDTPWNWPVVAITSPGSTGPVATLERASEQARKERLEVEFVEEDMRTFCQPDAHQGSVTRRQRTSASRDHLTLISVW